MKNLYRRLRDASAKARIAAAMVLAALVTVVLSPLAASAAPATLPPVPTDPTDGAMSTVLDKVIDWVLAYGVPALAVAIATGALIRIGFKWVRRAARAVG